MKISLFSVLLIFSSTTFFAQDSLFFVNNEALAVSIESISDNKIIYYLYEDEGENMKETEISMLKKIRYAQGNEQFFNTENDSFYHVDNGRSPEKDPDNEKEAFRTKLGLGFMLGTSIGKLNYFKDNEPIDNLSDYRFGPAAGVLVEWEMLRYLSLRTSIFYKEKGDRTDGESYIKAIEFADESLSAEGNGYINKYLWYLEGSFLPLLTIPNSDNSFQFQIGAGIYGAYGIRAEEKLDLYIDYYRHSELESSELTVQTNRLEFVNKISESEKEDQVSYYNSYDAGFIFYAGIKPRPFIINASFLLGAANIIAIDSKDLFLTNQSGEWVKNIGFELVFGYYL